MHHLRAFQRFALYCMVIVATAGSCVSLAHADSLDSASCNNSLYDADPNHLWNRLYGALFIRIGPDGHLYGQDRLEPLLWSHSKHLLDGNDHERAVAVLEEFLKSEGEKLIQSPLKRAVLQRDL
jgi:hypothetical protein